MSAVTNETCTTASWCVEHHETDPNVLVHLSSLAIAPNGVATGLKAYSGGDGEPIGGATLMMFTPLPGTPNPPETWRLEHLRAIFGASA